MQVDFLVISMVNVNKAGTGESKFRPDNSPMHIPSAWRLASTLEPHLSSIFTTNNIDFNSQLLRPGYI
jgi:hypothetical protein